MVKLGMALLLASVGIAPAFAQGIKPSPELATQVACMTRTLEQTAGIDQVRSDFVAGASVSYRDNSEAGKGATLKFKTISLQPPYQFQVTLGGLVDPRTGSPNTFGTDRIKALWKARCGVNALTLFV